MIDVDVGEVGASRQGGIGTETRQRPFPMFAPAALGLIVGALTAPAAARRFAAGTVIAEGWRRAVSGC
ncbi:hypothetical protein GCM10027590_27890 [Nocardiopsis nanhaiensis]